MTPQERVERQAAYCRARFRAMTAPERRMLADRLSLDPLDVAWAAVLRGEHPFAAWLLGDEPLERFSGTPSARQLVTSHPFRVERPWSSPAT